jgi:hypothetical protein
MKQGAIRILTWGEPLGGSSGNNLNSNKESHETTRLDTRWLVRPTELESHVMATLESDETAASTVAAREAPRLTPAPASAEEEAIALLRIAAEVEGSLLVQYLFAAGSLLSGVNIEVPGFDHPIQTDDWYDVVRTIAKQEMGHLVTVQNLLLSLGAAPHLDRENLPFTSPLYPFPFSLQPMSPTTLARFVSAEAPLKVAPADEADYADAVREAGTVVGKVPRAGQIYERLFWLFQDTDAPQEPWLTLENPFPDWPNWHVDSAKVGFNQDRQPSPIEWRGNDSDEGPDTAVYVLQVQDKSSARKAIYAVGLQGEGPVTEQDVTHFDKFLRIYRELRAVDRQAGAPAYARNQAPDPGTGLSGTPTITDPVSLLWAKLGNVRYQLLLMDIALAVSVGQAGAVPSTSATGRDLTSWAFREMLASIKPLSEELRQMPMQTGMGPSELRAGLPYELPKADLAESVSEQIAYLRDRLAEAKQLRARMESTLNPTPRQKGILKVLENFDSAMEQKLG